MKRAYISKNTNKHEQTHASSIRPLKINFVRMKIILFILIAASLITSSCTKLDENPKSQITSTSFYKTQSDAVSAVQSIYNDLTHNTSGDHASIYNRLLVLAVAMGTDDNIPGIRATNPDVRSIGAYTQTSTNTRYYELWRQHYEAINRANAAIDNLPSIKQGDTVVIKRLVLEAKFLRGLLYYNLVRLWGPVPLVVHETTPSSNLFLARTDTATVYQQIISDFTDATNLPKSYIGVDAFRATSGAANSFLLSVAVTRRQWSNVVSIYNTITSGGYGYALLPNYADIFSSSKKFTAEHIFDANFVADGTGNLTGTGNSNLLGYISAPINGYKVGGGLGADADAPILPLRSLFKANDKRTTVTFTDSVLATVNGKLVETYNPHFSKYLDPSSGINLLNNGINIPIIRFAEVVLFYAEAQNELGNSTEAYNAINQIRTRAGLPNLTVGLSKDDFRDSLFLERKLEFVYEQIRWFDLIRTNGSGTKLFAKALKALDPNGTSGTLGSPNYDPNGWVTIKSKVTDEHFTLLPIPATEIVTNRNLMQNPGW